MIKLKEWFIVYKVRFIFFKTELARYENMSDAKNYVNMLVFHYRSDIDYIRFETTWDRDVYNTHCTTDCDWLPSYKIVSGNMRPAWKN